MLDSLDVAVNWAPLAVFALLAVLVLLIRHRMDLKNHDLEVARLRWDQEREERRESVEREERREARAYEQARLTATSDTGSAFSSPVPEGAHSLVFTFDLGPGKTPVELLKGVQESLDLINALTAQHDVDRVEVRELTYKNPLDILLYIWAAEAAIGALVGTAVGINAAVQHIRRSNSHTGASKAEDRAIESRHGAERSLWDALRAEIESGNLRPKDADKVARAANALRSVEYRPAVDRPAQPRLLELPSVNE